MNLKNKMTEFNLSEKIDDSFVSDEDFDFIRTKDVKEFIRLLKEEINDPEIISNYGHTQQERLVIMLYVQDFINKKLNKLSGEKLT